jgi:hypothetical protein
MPGILFTRLIISMLVILCASSMVLAQKEIDFDAEGGLIQFNIFHFEGSDKYDLTLNLSEQVADLSLKIKSYISTGELVIEILDPTGEEQGNFSVRGQAPSDKPAGKNEIRRSTELITTKMRIEKDPWLFTEETFRIMGMGNNVAQASISRSFRNPIRGNWTIRVISTNAKGIFTVENNHKLVSAILGDLPSRKVTGTVTDSKNRPLAGVTVLVKGSSLGTVSDKNGNFTLPVLVKGSFLGTVSDKNGNFTLPVRDSQATLVFHYKGMISQEVAVGNQTKLSVVLKQQKQK